MQVVLAKVDSLLHRKIVESEGDVLNDMGSEEPVEGFSYELDAFDELDYRDIQTWARDPSHPMYFLFVGDVLVDGYEWTYGAPMYHSPEQTIQILRRFEECSQEDWQVRSVRDFLQRAANERKGVIVGVT